MSPRAKVAAGGIVRRKSCGHQQTPQGSRKCGRCGHDRSWSKPDPRPGRSKEGRWICHECKRRATREYLRARKASLGLVHDLGVP